MPKEYTAITKLSDEYKETELAIGFSNIKAYLKNAMGGANSGINDMGLYCKILKTEDFARNLSHQQVPGKDMTYGQYICDEDTIETIKEHINYNYSSRQETLTISFTDRDPVVAVQMLDSVTTLLQQIITQKFSLGKLKCLFQILCPTNIKMLFLRKILLKYLHYFTNITFSV